MPRNLVFLLALLLAMPMIAIPTSAASSELPLNVMTFNIRFGTAYDRENNWPNRQDMVIRMLKKYDADIIGTQETLDFQADYICQQMPEYRWFGPPRMVGGLPERCAILYKWREFEPIDTGTFWLSETPEVFGSQSWDSSLPRIATWARFHHMETGTEFYVYNTHFDHVGREARRESMRQILEHIEENTGDLPVIYVGDFNVTAERDDVYHILAETDFEDAWLTAAEQRGPVATWNAFRPVPEDSDRRIDWIFTRGPFEVDLCETITYSENDRFVSDHFPVVAKMRLQTGD